MIPPITNHGIWGCLHFLSLVSNIVLACYGSETFLSHLMEGGYGFDVLGSPGIDMYQMYIVAPLVKAGMTYIGVGLIYKPHGLFAGGVKRCATFLRTFFDRCESEIGVALSQAYFLQKRRGVSPLCHPMPTCICVDSIILCPGVIDKEDADMVGVHSSQTITFRMMITSTHFFHGIEERAHVFIPLDFKHPRDNRSLWRTGFFSYLDGVWEWVQVTCDHVANHYTTLAHAYAMTKASARVHRQVSSTALPMECSLAITLIGMGPLLSHRAHYKMSRFIQDPLILQVTGRPGRNTLNQSQESSLLTRLSQRSARTE